MFVVLKKINDKFVKLGVDFGHWGDFAWTFKKNNLVYFIFPYPGLDI